MRDVTRKIDTLRTATAQTTVRIGATGRQHLAAGTLPKGDPYGICQAAGMLAAKRTSELIPHCHNLPLDGLDIAFEQTAEGVVITAHARTVWKTGVEMEALTAASVAALTLYDLLKPVEADLVIAETRLTQKAGGESQFEQFFAQVQPRYAILVASDRASDGTYQDASGAKIREILAGYRGVEAGYAVLPDDRQQLAAQLAAWTDSGAVDFIFTSGGTGIAPRDVMVEATAGLIEREIPGIAEAMRNYSQRRKPLAMFTRGLVGVRGKTMIINLPGSPKGVEECMEALLPFVLHAVSELAKAAAPTPAAQQPPAQEHHPLPMGAQPAMTPAAPIAAVAPPPPPVAAPAPAPAPVVPPTTGTAPVPRFDPVTGAPLDATPAPIAAAPFEPQGANDGGAAAHLDPGWRGTLYSPTVTPEPQPSVPMFDPNTGEPIGYAPAPAPPMPAVDDATPPPMPGIIPPPVAPTAPEPPKPDDTSMFTLPS